VIVGVNVPELKGISSLATHFFTDLFKVFPWPETLS
jgi:hypothetical protein